MDPADHQPQPADAPPPEQRRERDARRRRVVRVGAKRIVVDGGLPGDCAPADDRDDDWTYFFPSA
jgi:hypothetical protein